MARSTSANDNGPFVYKWRSGPNVFNSPANYYVLRLADVRGSDDRDQLSTVPVSANGD